MTPWARVRAHWQTLFRMPQGLFLSAGLVLVVGGVALAFGVLWGAWESVQRIELAQALITAGEALVLCAAVFGRLLEQPATPTQTVLPRVVRRVALSLTAIALFCAAVGSAQIAASPLIMPWETLLFPAMGSLLLLSLWNVVIGFLLP